MAAACARRRQPRRFNLGPDLIKHDGRYYLYYPAAGTNWVVTAKTIAGPWSQPVSIGVGHIDPGHVVGDDGRRYIHLSGGHAVEMSADGLKAATRPQRVYDGWPIPRDWTIECFCLESPKLTRRDGWYYLTSAQGGTSGPTTSHMVVSARSRQPLGPWDNSPHNPIIRTGSRDEAWWSKGHGTLVEGPGGQWYCVLHGYLNGFRTLGRCTLLEPIEWTRDGWFCVAERWPAEWPVAQAPRLPGRPKAGSTEMPASDDFEGTQLGLQWQFYSQYDPQRFRLADGHLALDGRGDTPGNSQPLSVMAMHRAYEIETELSLEGDASAGLMLFGPPGVYIGLALGPDGKLRRVQEGFRRYGGTDEPAIGASRVTLRIVNDQQDVRFYYKSEHGPWVVLQPGMDVSSMTTAGWHALRPALFVTGAGRGRFASFRYEPHR